MVDLEYESISNTLSVKSAWKIKKMALLFAKSQIQNSLFQLSDKFYLEIFLGPTTVGPRIDTGCLTR